MSIRRARLEDLLTMQEINLRCLPENYPLRYFLMHFLSWPELLWVAEVDDPQERGQWLSPSPAAGPAYLSSPLLTKHFGRASPSQFRVGSHSCPGASCKCEQPANEPSESSRAPAVPRRVVGYVMGKLDTEPNGESHGHITSVAVLHSFRGMGLATRLMRQTLYEMENTCGVAYCTLHVRFSNTPAQHLYQKTIGYLEKECDHNYFQDGENAWKMWCRFAPSREARQKELDERAASEAKEVGEVGEMRELGETGPISGSASSGPSSRRTVVPAV